MLKSRNIKVTTNVTPHVKLVWKDYCGCQATFRSPRMSRYISGEYGRIRVEKYHGTLRSRCVSRLMLSMERFLLKSRYIEVTADVTPPVK